MKRTIITALATLGMILGVAAPAQAINNSVTPHGDHRVAAVAQQYTSQGSRICTGTLIDPMWVLTAAHCLSSAPHGSVGFGIHGANSRTSYSTTYMHPDRSVDIGLIRLDRPAAGVPTMGYNMNPFHIAVGQRGDIFGWGGHATQRGTMGRAHVQVEYPLFRFAKGPMAVTTTLDGAVMIGGDSGGPLFMTHSNTTVAAVQSHINYAHPHKGWLTPTHLAGPWIAGTIAAGIDAGMMANTVFGSATGIAG